MDQVEPSLFWNDWNDIEVGKHRNDSGPLSPTIKPKKQRYKNLNSQYWELGTGS